MRRKRGRPGSPVSGEASKIESAERRTRSPVDIGCSFAIYAHSGRNCGLIPCHDRRRGPLSLLGSRRHYGHGRISIRRAQSSPCRPLSQFCSESSWALGSTLLLPTEAVLFDTTDTGANLAGTMGEVVPTDLAPGANVVPGGAKSSGTKLAQPGTSLAPSGTPFVTITPRSTSAAVSPSVSPFGSPALSLNPSVSPSATPTPTPVVPRTNTPTPSPATTPTPTPSESYQPEASPLEASRVVINEVAWSGTASGSATVPRDIRVPYDEWIELYNCGERARRSLDGWHLCARMREKVVTFSGWAQASQPGAYLLMERTDDRPSATSRVITWAHLGRRWWMAGSI